VTSETQLAPAAVEIPNSMAEAPSESVPLDAIVIKVGTGSGNLTVDGRTLNVSGNAFLKVKGGTYQTITVKNLIAISGKRIFIKNDGEVKVTEAMYTDNLNNVTISGDNVSGLKYGFKFENINYRAIMMNGKLNGVTIRNMSFKNVSNYVIAGERNNGRDFQYKGTAETRTENFKILNCLFNNTGQIAFGGELNKDRAEDSGFFKYVEIAYNTFRNTDAGSLCSFTNVQKYDIHHNLVDNVNPKNNNHNGIFFMVGSGIFHHNKLANYQGNAIRMWLYSRGTNPETNEIYQNMCYNTRKYGAFELQVFDSQIQSGKSTYANAKVYNNTVGKMNTSKDWEGQVLDLYNTGGTLEYYNNLGFDLVSNTKQPPNMINNMSGKKPIKELNNRYFKDLQDAVDPANNYRSRIAGIGAL
jgi:hypothetical protein